MCPSKPGGKCKHNYLGCSVRNKHLHSSEDAEVFPIAHYEQAGLGDGTKRGNQKLPNGIWTSTWGTELLYVRSGGLCLLLPSFLSTPDENTACYFCSSAIPLCPLSPSHHPYPRAELQSLRTMAKTSTVSLGCLCLPFQFIYKMLPE